MANLPVGQQRNNPSALKVAHNRAVAVVAAEGPVVDADNTQWFGVLTRAAANNAEQRVVAHRYHQALGDAGGRSSAQRQAEVVHKTVHASRAARPGSGDAIAKALGEDLPADSFAGRNGSGAPSGANGPIGRTTAGQAPYEGTYCGSGWLHNDMTGSWHRGGAPTP